MFCSKCGAQIDGNAKFCVKCGAQITQAGGRENSAGSSEPLALSQNITELAPTQPKSGKARKILSLIALVVIILALVGVLGGLGYFMVYQRSDEQTYTGYLKKADECYDAEDYEGAIGYYLEALEIEDSDPDVYESLARAYMEIGDNEEVAAVLETGYEVTEAAKLKRLLEELAEASDEEEQGDGSGADYGEEWETYTGEKTSINIEVRQVDASNFPEIVLYASITNEAGDTVEQMSRKDFKIREIDANGNVKDAVLDDVYQVLNEDNIRVNLVLDKSGSMNSSQKMPQAKNAANALVDYMELTSGDAVEVISFDDYVYLEQEFSSQATVLHTAIDGIQTGGSTALYDALYAGLYQTYYETGAKCVIAFTDGAENASSYTFDDVVELAQNTGIPVFIIGIGDSTYDASALRKMAEQCSGRYYSADSTGLETILEDIYISIYQEQQDYYVLKYTSDDLNNVTQFRDVVVETSEYTEFSGYYTKAYVPQADIYGAFSDSYMDMDYMIEDSDTRAVTEADLSQMSLAQLRIARNEIFARHGRQFKDSMLNQWFYSKAWYLNIPVKYDPDTFDALTPNPLSQLELSNANFIKSYEEQLMARQDIYPDAANTLLSDYDLALSKAVLRQAYTQIQDYASTAILEENKKLLLEAINKEDVQY